MYTKKDKLHQKFMNYTMETVIQVREELILRGPA